MIWEATGQSSPQARATDSDGLFDPDGTVPGQKILVRTDSAGASRKFLWHLHHAGAQFSVSYPVPAGKAHMVDWISDKQSRQQAE